MRRSARVDTNQASIVELLRSIGCLVEVTSSLGHGFPDLVVWVPRAGAIVLVEVKDGDKPVSKQSLTEAERGFHLCWSSAPLYIINSDESALAMLQDAAKRYGGE